MGMSDVVSAMIEDGADVNAVDENGLTPLHDAAQAGHTKVQTPTHTHTHNLYSHSLTLSLVLAVILPHSFTYQRFFCD
jgi:ankyrin repeat protein